MQTLSLDGLLSVSSHFYRSIYSLEFSSSLLTVNLPEFAAGAPAYRGSRAGTRHGPPAGCLQGSDRGLEGVGTCGVLLPKRQRDLREEILSQSSRFRRPKIVLRVPQRIRHQYQSVDTGGELSGMARTLRFVVADPDAKMRVLRIRHQYQCWVWAKLRDHGCPIIVESFANRRDSPTKCVL
jgi:hypothetical protein